jgi:hypothetical protein
LGGANVNATTHTGTTVSVTGNITGGNILGGANVNATTHTGTTVSVTGTVTAANVNAAAIGNSGAAFTGASISAATIGNSGALITGTLQTAAQTNITSVGTLGSLSVTGNITGGNLITAGVASATGNITTSNYFVGNGAFLTGISAAISVSKIENGNSNVWVQSSGGEVAVTVTNVSNVAVFGTSALTLVGGYANPKTLSRNITIPASVNAMLVGPITIDNGATMTIPDSSDAYIYL